MESTGYSSAKVYQVLATLGSAKWLDRLDDPAARPELGGPARISYRLRPELVTTAHRVVAQAPDEMDIELMTGRQHRERVGLGRVR